ncbi:3-ketoacyl-CoA synthase 2, DAISY [Hibiscus trionum]|uniref:3-ketoacyl-CoA synthase n=1 Tax=Hibiscus trionum TaxID=183268 RepID=A0A9W7LMK2_HIBTR|nr:3-ketoacyl-CoA synthase 2, DAISY [Hibiscus trionum]
MNEKKKTSLANEHIESVRLKYVKLCYHFLVSNALYLSLILTLFCLILTHPSTFAAREMFLLSISIGFLATIYSMRRPRQNVYLVNFASFKPGKDRMVSKELFMQLCGELKFFTQESLGFLNKILERSGLGERTYGSAAVMKVPVIKTMVEARNETETVMFGAIDEVLGKTGVKPGDIGIVVVNSSLFNPSPSLAATIVNHYKLRQSVVTYNLAGMGCSAGIISIDLAKQLLQVHGDTYALVVSTENLTNNWYKGNNRAMLVTNCLFRVGGAAVLLSNRSSDRCRAKYELVQTLRTHTGADDRSYNCVHQQEDEANEVGVSLSKDLMVVAGEALKANITALGPLVLPVSEQLLFLATLLLRKALGTKIVKPYVPNFKLAFEHFCIHAGGRSVLDELEKSLRLLPLQMEPSRMTLYRFGNTSSSSLWYEMAYLEAKGRIKKRDRVWQIGFGSGFKCNSCVWRALKPIDPTTEINPWMSEIDEFPVEVPLK